MKEKKQRVLFGVRRKFYRTRAPKVINDKKGVIWRRLDGFTKDSPVTIHKAIFGGWALLEIIPSKTRRGENFESVEKKMNHVPKIYYYEQVNNDRI